MSILYKSVFKCFFSAQRAFTPKICIIGGGPAGFYAAQHLVKNLPNAEIDILERLPVPFGLVRFGVAPDHPEVKNVINTFTKTAQNPRVRFIGNVHLGKSFTLQHVQDAYHAVLLTYGAEQDKNLNIPGEDLTNVISARTIVGWYNGVPWNSDLKIDLSGSTAVIIGQGNVAIDVARILLTPIDLLKMTDITQHALDQLMTSNIREVYLIGRRGPLQAAFTIKELREILKLPNCHTKWTHSDFIGVKDIVASLARPKKRIAELMLNSLKNNDSNHETKSSMIPKFLRSPIQFNGDGNVSSVTLAINKLIGDNLQTQLSVTTEETEEIGCDLAIRSIGYKSIKADSAIPFDDRKGLVDNKEGRVGDNLYSAGWLATGPTGVILSTMSNSFEIAHNVCKDFNTSQILNEYRPGFNTIRELIKQKNIPIVTWSGWEQIDKYEQEMGKKLGKPREKIISIEKMLEIGAEN